MERGTPDEPRDFIDFYLAEIEKVSVHLPGCTLMEYVKPNRQGNQLF